MKVLLKLEFELEEDINLPSNVSIASTISKELTYLIDEQAKGTNFYHPLECITNITPVIEEY